MLNEDKLYINGINGATGDYLVQPLEYRDAAAFIRGERRDTKLGRFLRRIWRVISSPYLGLPIDTDPADVAQAGWAVVFHADEGQYVQDALARLVEHRRQQIGDDTKVKILTYREGEDWSSWLARHGVGAGNIEPTKVPYYILLVGSPQQIPFSFGHLLDVEYAVGRLHFDTPEEYASYVDSVIAYETDNIVPNAREAVFFGTRHKFDRATQLSADLLVNPLADGLPATGNRPAQTGVAESWGFHTQKIWGDAATKDSLIETFARSTDVRPPAFLFTASHGVGFPKGHERQASDQGALVCQDWPGFGSIGQQHYFTAKDVPTEARVHGLITFHFACYGAGTPSHDRYFHKPDEPPPAIADEAFIAELPKALLTHPGGGTLACVGHVERAWSYSIQTPLAGPQLLPFQNAIGRILIGQPVGYAMKDFNERYAALSTSLIGLLEDISFGAQISDQELATNWIERNDAEGYVIIGDPAVKLRVNDLM